MESGTTASVRVDASLCTVRRGRIDTPAAMMMACLIVSMLSNSITVLTFTLCCRSARSIALRVVSRGANAADVAPPREGVVGMPHDRHRLGAGGHEGERPIGRRIGHDPDVRLALHDGFD